MSILYTNTSFTTQKAKATQSASFMIYHIHANWNQAGLMTTKVWQSALLEPQNALVVYLWFYVKQRIHHPMDLRVEHWYKFTQN